MRAYVKAGSISIGAVASSVAMFRHIDAIYYRPPQPLPGPEYAWIAGYNFGYYLGALITASLTAAVVGMLIWFAWNVIPQSASKEDSA